MAALGAALSVADGQSRQIPRRQRLSEGDGSNKENLGGCNSRSPNSSNEASSKSKSIKSAHAIRNSVLLEGEPSRKAQNGGAWGRAGLLPVDKPPGFRSTECPSLLLLLFATRLPLLVPLILLDGGTAEELPTSDGLPT